MLIAYVGGEQYHFEYEDCGDMWEALEQFWHEDYPETLMNVMHTAHIRVDVLAMDGGKCIRRYETALDCAHYHSFFDHGHTVHGPYTLDEFNRNLKEIREKLNVRDNGPKPNDVTKAKDIIALWSDWCMDWGDENLWLDYMVKHPKGHCNRQHLQEKWDYCYEKYGNKATMTMFWRELDNDNRAILTEYITTQWHKN